MKILLGIFSFSFGFYLALWHLNQGIVSFYDFVAVVLVVVGSFSAAYMTMPAIEFKKILKTLVSTLTQSATSKREVIAKDLIESLKKNGAPISTKVGSLVLPYGIYNDGLEMIDLGFSKEKIKSLLVKRIGQSASDTMKVSNWLRSSAKYPPAFGLMGTVMGMVHLMKGLSNGSGSEETGLRMAVALIATFYGIILSNVFFSPLGERIKEELQESVTLAELAVEGVMLKIDRSNLLEAQEEINSYLDESKRLNVLSGVA
jgi:chemotaxis protein MotA